MKHHNNQPLIRRLLFTVLMLQSALAFASMACTDQGEIGVWNNRIEGICVSGPDKPDRGTVADMVQRVAVAVAKKLGGTCEHVGSVYGAITVERCTKRACPSCDHTFGTRNYGVRLFTNPLYLSSSSTRSSRCTFEADPCDPATGKVFLTETDIPDEGNGLSFSRYYQSNGLNQAKGRIGHSWRHSYSGQLDALPRADTLHNLPLKRSGYYTSKEAACLQGATSIVTSLYSGQYKNASLSYQDSVCRLVQDGITIAEIPLEKVNTQDSVSSSASEHTIIRPSGESYRFRIKNGVWVNLENRSVSLVQDGTDWLLTLANLTVERYDSTGYLQTSRKVGQQATTYQYENGLLKTITGSFGHVLTLSYLEEKISEVSGPTGTVSYLYDDIGNLVKVTYPDGSMRQYIYDDFYHISLLTGILDENNQRVATWQYDSIGRVIMNERANGIEHYEFTYNSDGTTTVVDGLGASRIYQFDVVNNALKFVNVEGDRCDTCGHGTDKSRTYNENGHISGRTSWNGFTTTYVRDDAGLELSRIEAVGTPQARTIRTQWHAVFKKPLRITEPDRITDFTYDANGRLLNKVEQSIQ